MSKSTGSTDHVFNMLRHCVVVPIHGWYSFLLLSLEISQTFVVLYAGSHNNRERMDYIRSIFFTTNFTAGQLKGIQAVQTSAPFCISNKSEPVPCVENRRYVDCTLGFLRGRGGTSDEQGLRCMSCPISALASLQCNAPASLQGNAFTTIDPS